MPNANLIRSIAARSPELNPPDDLEEQIYAHYAEKPKEAPANEQPAKKRRATRRQ